MSKTFKVSEDVVRFVDEIIDKYQLKPIKEVKFKPGSEVGDNYASQTIAVTIIKPEGIIELFLKCALDIKSTEVMPIDKLYANEIYFYDTVYPAYLKFLNQHNSGNKNDFRNVPKCFGTFNQRDIIALENLKRKGFKLFPRNQIINAQHVRLVFKTFAKFHAISYAFKDQDRKIYDDLAANTFDFLSAKNGETPFLSIIRGSIKDFLKKLDPHSDKLILDKCNVEDLVTCITSADTNLDEFSILTQGDCWCNNMMFLYEDGDSKNPIDMMMIDWQLLRPASPIYDMSYFFLTISPEELLNRTDEFLKVYHDELSRRIRELGSDPEALYPFAVLLKQWKKYCKFGFGMATIIMKVMLSKKDEAFSLEEMDLDNTEQLENLYAKFENEDEYLRRMRILANYMIRNDYI